MRLQPKRSIEILADVLGIGRNIDPQLFDESLRDRTVRRRTLDRVSPAKAKPESIVPAELVALRMSAKVIVIVEDQDASFVARSLPEIVRSSQSADSSTNNHQIVGLAGIFRFRSVIRERSVANLVHRLKRPRMRPTKPSLSRRIIARSILWLKISSRSRPHFRRNQSGASCDCNSVKKVAARDLRAHPEYSVPFVRQRSLRRASLTLRPGFRLWAWVIAFRYLAVLPVRVAALSGDPGIRQVAANLLYESAPAADREDSDLQAQSPASSIWLDGYSPCGPQIREAPRDDSPNDR